ncbi:MAG: CPBP family intramembrane metalloprotease [Oscillospiraceae bacterium]|nr:CPBP family intramembrane metalloprotease [Oscillospiraceae bacterium]
MPGKKKKSSDNRIASLKIQNAEYNELYRSWRIEHRSDVGFYFAENPDEITWRDGEGFIGNFPLAEERSAMGRTASVMGKTLTMFALLELAILWLFSDVRVGGAFIGLAKGGFFMGSETPALIMSYIVNIVKRILPLFYLVHKVGMPVKVMLPVKVANKPMFRAAVPAAMLVFGVTTLLSGVESFALGFLSIDTGNTIWIPDGKIHLVLSALLYIVIIPVISEIIHRGLFMQTLRQFGDGCALIFTSVISALSSPGTHSWIFTLTYSFIVGFFVIRSGSILTGIFMRIVISACTYIMTFLRLGGTDPAMYLNISMLIVMFCLLFGGAGMIVFMYKHSNKINLPFYGMYISNKEKVMCMVTCPWIIAWLTVTVITAMMNSVL